MCSIDEAWAGQDFDNKPVVSQADIHNAYMSVPDNVFQRGNDFNLNEPNQPKSREFTRGLNSKYSREPRIPKMVKNTNDVSLNISSQMPPLNNYGGLEPLPSFMSIYDTKTKKTQPHFTQPHSTQPHSTQPHSTQSVPQPTSTGDNFTDINNAFQTSRLMNNFMTMGKTYNNNEKLEFEDNLINENTHEEDTIINSKFESKQNKNTKKKNKFSDINSKNNNNNNNNNYEDNDYEDNDYEDNDYEDNDYKDKTNNYNNQMIKHNNSTIEKMLSKIITKLNEMEDNLHLYQKRNMYDIILYIIIGMLISFIIYSTMKK